MKSFILLIILFFSTSLIAESPKVHFSIRPERATQDTEFIVQISISGQNFANTGSPVFEENDEMSLSSMSSSVQQQIINGSISFQKTFLFKINFSKVLATGEYLLPRGSILIDGNKYRFPTKKIFIEAPNTNSQDNVGVDTKLAATNNTFQFVQNISNAKPYIGEQILYKVEIIAPHNLEKAQLEEFEPQGLWRERYGQDEKRIRSVQNTTIHSFSESWYPIQAGVLEVPERILMAEVKEYQRKQRPNFNLGSSFSDQLLGGLLPYLNQFKRVEKKLIAEPFKIEVKPLPTPPIDIKGFVPVGNLKITSSFDSESVKLGEPITLTIQISGDANLRPLEISDPKNLDNKILKRYDEKPILSRTIGESNVVFYKTFKISLIPLKSGFIKIPQFRIDWFNPVSEKYENYLTPEESIKVIGEETTQDFTPEIIENEKQEEQETQINNDLNSEYNIPYLSRKTSLSSGIFLFTLYILLFCIKFIKNLKLLNIIKQKSLIKNKKKFLKNSISSSQNFKDVDIFQSFKEILSLKYNENLQSLTPIELYKYIKTKFSPKLSNDVLEIFTLVEENKYSGKLENTLGNNQEKLLKLIDEI